MNNSNNVLEIFSKYMSYAAVCNCHSVQGPSTHNQWPVTFPRPHRGSGTSCGQLWCYSSWTEQQFLMCAVLVTTKSRNETAGCLLSFQILNKCSLPNICWVFTPVACWNWLPESKIWYKHCTIDYIPFLKQYSLLLGNHESVLKCSAAVVNSIFSLKQAFRPFLFWLSQPPPELHVSAKRDVAHASSLTQMSWGLWFGFRVEKESSEGTMFELKLALLLPLENKITADTGTTERALNQLKPAPCLFL